MSGLINMWTVDDSLVVTTEVHGVAQDNIDPTVRKNTLIIDDKRNPVTDDMLTIGREHKEKSE